MSTNDDLYKRAIDEAYNQQAAMFNQNGLWQNQQQLELEYAKWHAMNAHNLTAAQAQQLSQFARQGLLNNAASSARKPTSFKIDDKPVIEDL